MTMDEENDAIERAINKLFNKLARAMRRGTGCKLSSEEIEIMYLSSISNAILAEETTTQSRKDERF